MSSPGSAVAAPAASVVRTLVAASHPGPTLAVTVLAGLLALAQGVSPSTGALLVAAVLAGQLTVGWSNDLVDRSRDRATGLQPRLLSWPEVREFAARADLFDAVAAYAQESALLETGAGEEVAVRVVYATTNYFDVLGVRPALGRGGSDTTGVAMAAALKAVGPRAEVVVAELVPEAKSRDSENTILHKRFPGGVLSVIGANSGRGFRRGHDHRHRPLSPRRAPIRARRIHRTLAPATDGTQAERVDRPPFKVMSEATLLALARHAPRDLEGLALERAAAAEGLASFSPAFQA